MPKPLTDTRERMLDAAEALFQSHGYGGTAVEDVTTAVGVKKPNLYNHFRGKRELYIAVRLREIQRVGARITLTLAEEQAFEDRLQAVVETLLAHPAFLAAPALRRSEVFLPPETRDYLFARAYGAVYEPVTTMMLEAARDGHLPLHRAYAGFAFEALAGLAAHFALVEGFVSDPPPAEPQPPPDPERVRYVAGLITRLFLHGASGLA